MTLLTDTIPALFQGVSQQSPTLRAPEQAEEQINAWATIADGLRKRAPSEHIARLQLGAIGDAFVHHINRDTTERYIVVITSGTIKVFDHQTGEEKIVNYPAGAAYLTASNPSDDFACVSVADYTFVVNKTIAPALGAVGADTAGQPVYNRWVNRLGVDGQPIQPGSTAQYPPNPAGGVYRGEVQSFEDLPDTPNNGDIYKVTGSAETLFTSYYVRRNGGVWDETVAPGLANAVDETTMPHALVRLSDGSFTFAPFSWAPRRVGDGSTNPAPTFIGRSIRDVLFYQNRLGFLVDENVVLSVAGDFGNYWRTTVLDYLESDVIDVATTETKVSLLNHAITFNDGIMLFADQTQFLLSHGEEGLTASSVAITPVTHYKVNTKVRPEPLGTDVYFASDAAKFTILWEYFHREDEDSTTAANVTAHVPRYIPAGVSSIATSDDLDAVFVATAGAANRIYAYKFHWVGQEKAQSAWGYWEFEAGDQILSIEVLDEFLYVLTQRADGAYLDRIDLHSGAMSPGLDRQCYLDRRFTVTGTYLPGEDKTLFGLPYPVPQADFRLVRSNAFVGQVGSLVDPSQYEWIDATNLKVPGDQSAGICIGGARYEMRYTFSRQFVRDRAGRPRTTGRLQLRTFTIYYTDSAYFKTEVSRGGLSPDVETIIPAKLAEFTGKTLGDTSLVIGEPAYHAGSYRFQVYGNAEHLKATLVNDSHVGADFQSAEWEGFYFNRAA